MNPTVSVIIPAYNVERYIDESVSSILNQTYKDFEIVICDDCSTDGTWQKLQKYTFMPNVTVISNEENLKEAATRNRCISNCKGKYILLHDADDVSEPNRIERLLDSFDDEVDFVGSSCYCFNSRDGKFKNLINKHEYPMPNHLVSGMPFVHASIIFRKKCLEDVGGYRQSKHTIRGADYDLIMRLYAVGYRGKNINELLYGYRVDNETVSRRSFKARLDECVLRYYGFKANHILFPIGWLYVFKPVVAHFYQVIKYWKLLR